MNIAKYLGRDFLLLTLPQIFFFGGGGGHGTAVHSLAADFLAGTFDLLFIFMKKSLGLEGVCSQN